MYSAYAPPYARPSTSSPILKSSCPSGPKLSITPENSTPMVGGAWGGRGYRPSRWSRSMRFSPKARILMMASPSAAVGLAIWSMKRFVAGPLPPLMPRGC